MKPILSFLCAFAVGPRIAMAADAPGPGANPIRSETNPPFEVSGGVALASLMSLSDNHLMKMADLLHTLALSEAVRTGEWERIRPALEVVSRRSVPALNWFALPDGSYWSVQKGEEAGNLSGRAYFPKVLAGKTVVGELVVSTATRKPVAIVAAPVTGADQKIVGVLGASVYLDQMSQRIQKEMRLDPSTIFYSFDETPLIALNWDPGLIFFRPMESEEAETTEVFAQMLERESGAVRYRFRGGERSVLFRKSPVTGWWYALGVREP